MSLFFNAGFLSKKKIKRVLAQARKNIKFANKKMRAKVKIAAGCETKRKK
jgi:hypothetical protein